MCRQSDTSRMRRDQFCHVTFLPLPARKVYEGGLRSQGTISISGSVSVEGAGIDGDASPPGCVTGKTLSGNGLRNFRGLLSQQSQFAAEPLVDCAGRCIG